MIFFSRSQEVKRIHRRIRLSCIDRHLKEGMEHLLSLARLQNPKYYFHETATGHSEQKLFPSKLLKAKLRLATVPFVQRGI